MIVAIGGGDLGNQSSAVDGFLVRATGKTSPRVLFVPTASKDAPGYSELVRRHFSEGWGCDVRALTLLSNPSPRHVAAEMAWADVVYAGGGSTPLLIRTWNRFGMAKLCQAALDRGAVLAGISAGAICWFEGGLAAYNRYQPLPGLGFVRGTVVPHYRPGDGGALSPVGTGPVFGISDGAALVWDGLGYGALAETPEAGVWVLGVTGPARLPAYEAPRGEKAADTL